MINRTTLGLGIVLVGLIGFEVLAVSKTHRDLDTASINSIANITSDLSVHGQNKKFNLDTLKFVNSKVTDSDGNKIISTRIKNDSGKRIVGVKYTYDIGGKISIIDMNEDLLPGDVSEQIAIKVKNRTSLRASELLRANIKFVDSKNEICNLEFVKSA
ncbi:MAG: hypothetical protein ACRCWG_15590 [Sarcina sp.]